MQATQPFQMRRLGVVMRGDPRDPDEALGVLNPAAARAPDGTLYLFPRVVAAGDALLSPRVTRRLIAEFARLRPTARVTPEALRELTPREAEVLSLIAGGLSNAEIAERLVVSEETVKTHVSHVLAKLGVRDRAQAVVVAFESGLVTPRADL